MTLSRLGAGLTAVFVLIVPVMADEIYTYTGNPFTVTSVPSGGFAGQSIDGSFTIAAALADDLTFAPSPTIGNVIPLSYSFTDGVNTFTNLNSVFYFNFETNGSGVITEWFASTSTGGLNTAGLSTQDDGSPMSPTIVDQGNSAFDNTGGQNENDKGVWSASSTSTVPEPGNLALVGLGLVAIGIVRRRLLRHGLNA
jgi:PEP-CTERM motif